MSVDRYSGKYDYKEAKSNSKYQIEAFLNGAVFLGLNIRMMRKGLYSWSSIVLTPMIIYFYASINHKLDIISYLDAKKKTIN